MIDSLPVQRLGYILRAADTELRLPKVPVGTVLVIFGKFYPSDGEMVKVILWKRNGKAEVIRGYMGTCVRKHYSNDYVGVVPHSQLPH